MPTHFPFTDGKNYIRGDTEIEGKLCIGDKCIDGRHLHWLAHMLEHGINIYSTGSQKFVHTTDGNNVEVADQRFKTTYELKLRTG